MLPTFKSLKQGKPFDIGRPIGLKVGSVETRTIEAEPLPKSERSGNGNYEINRLGFYADPIKGRDVRFDQPVPISTGDVTLGDTYVMVRDITDVEWIAEERRLRAILTPRFTTVGTTPTLVNALVDKELAINKPLGRDQRLVRKRTEDVSNTKDMSTNSKLQTIFNNIQLGRADSDKAKKDITAQLIQILGDVNALAGIPRNQVQSLTGLNLPKTNRSFGLVDVCGKEYYNKNMGLVNLYLLNKANEEGKVNYNVNTPVIGLFGTYVGLPSLKTNLSEQTAGFKYLDLVNTIVIKQEALKTRLTSGTSYNINFDMVTPANLQLLTNRNIDITYVSPNPDKIVP